MIRKFDLDNDKLEFDYNYNNIETAFLNKKINNNAAINIEDIRRIVLWKLDRIINIPDEVIDDLKKFANKKSLDIKDSKTQEVIEKLLSCDGVGFPMASTILKFIRPDVFPIIDIRSYRVIFGVKLYSSQYSLDKYINYIGEVYKIRDRLNIDLPLIDQQLYCFDKEFTYSFVPLNSPHITCIFYNSHTGNKNFAVSPHGFHFKIRTLRIFRSTKYIKNRITKTLKNVIPAHFKYTAYTTFCYVEKSAISYT